MAAGLLIGFELDRRWHWLRGEMEESKKRLKDLKSANEKLTNDITALVGAIAEGYSEFEKDKKNFLRDLKQCEQMQEARLAAVENAQVIGHLTQELTTHKTAITALQAFSPFDVLEVSAESARVSLRFEEQPAIPASTLLLSFAPNSQLTGAALVPATVAFEDVLEEALLLNDPAFLIQEVQQRISNHFALRRQVADLQARFQLTLADNIVTAHFPHGSATLRIDSDHRVALDRVDSAKAAPEIEALRTAINQGTQPLSLADALEALATELGAAAV